MIQSTWTDPVLGVDTHIVLVPTPAGPVPTPLPSPFTGIVLDPAGLAINQAMGGSLVLVNSLPATNCGTAVMNMPPHLPVPGPFAKGKLDDDAKLLFGALNVSIGGTLAVRLGDIALSCNDPVRLPVSVVLAIPKGSLVLVMPAMVPDLALIAQELAFFAFRWWQKNSKLWAAISKKLKFAEENPSRLKQLWNDTVCFLTGHPVDVATGRVITSHVDLELPGRLPLRFERRYDSAASGRDGTLAPGWSHNYAEALWPERGRFVFRAPDGREIEFSTLHLPDRVLNAGDEVYLARERLTLRCPRQHQYTITDAKGTVREFFAVQTDPRRRARLVRIKNRVGEEQRFTYGEDGRLENVIDMAGRFLHFEYDRSGRLARVDVVGTDGKADPVTLFTYDTAGDLVEAKDALGHAYRYQYVEHLLVKETNKNGLSFYFQYDGVDANAKCIRTWGDGGIYDHVITYTPDNTKTLVENSLGYVTLYEMNDRGQVVAVTDALGRKTTYAYDEKSGQPLAEINALGAATNRVYDERGNLTKVIRPDGGEISFGYDPADRPTSAVDQIGGKWSWSHDDLGRLVGRTTSGDEKTQFHWDGSRLVAVTDPAGQHTQLGFDAAGNLTSLTTPDGVVSRWSYDTLGLLRTSTDPNGNVRRRYRDPLGRIERIDEPDGNQRTMTYDGEGNVTRVIDRHHDVRFEYTGVNRLAARTEAGTRVEFQYDTEGRLTSVKNEHGFVYRFVLDAVGETAEEHGFDGLRRRYVHDAAGRLSLTARPEGRTSKYAYDANSRLVGVTHSDGAFEAYEYRKDGALIGAKNNDAEVRFDRDPAGRIVKEIMGEDWVASVFDSLGRRRKVLSSKGLAQQIRRNSMGDVVAVDARVEGSRKNVDPLRGASRPDAEARDDAAWRSGFSAAFTRDQMGLELERALPGGIRARWHHDALGRPVRQEIWRGETSIGARQYVWDVGNRLRKLIDAFSGPVEYVHDVLGNLESASYADGRVELRMPDAVGNLFRSHDRNDRKYGATGQLLEARTERGVTRYEYDSEGNLVKKIEPDGRAWSYEWNLAGMLTRVVRPDERVVTFSYDALGRRVAKTYRGKTTRFIWDRNVPLHEWVERAPDAADDEPEPEQTAYYDGEKALRALLERRPSTGPPDGADSTRQSVAARSGTKEAPVTWLFHPESSEPLAKLVNGDCYGIVTDHLGAPRAMYDGAGDEVWAADTDTYGALRNLRGAQAACPFRWPGQYEDAETGLHYNRFRYYDPDAGTYVSQDPIRLAGGRALHGFLRDPLRSLDEFGLGVFALFEHQGNIHEGVNPTARGADRPREPINAPPGEKGFTHVNNNTFDAHAEIDAMNKAAESGARGGKGVLMVEGEEVCRRCEGDVKKMARLLDLDSLEVHELDTGRVATFTRDELRNVEDGGASMRSKLKGCG